MRLVERMALTQEQLEALATGPAAASGDNGSHTMRTADDVLKLERAAAERSAMSETDSDSGKPVSAWAGLRPARFVPPGAV